MFRIERSRSPFATAFRLAGLIYHSTVHSVRQSHRNAIVGLLLNIMQAAMLVGAFYVMMYVLEMRSSAVRGDFILYLFSGIFIYMTNTKAVGAVAGAPAATSSLMQHHPMNTAVAITSAALGSLYNQFLSLTVILALIHVAWRPIEVDHATGVGAMVMLSWFFGVSVGMVFYAVKPWFPLTSGIIRGLYTRVNMFASGKLFLGNTLGASTLIFFTWNPLFHIIDQARGFAFINYNPHNSNLEYPIQVSVVLLVIGLMGEYYTRRHSSLSWSAT